MNHAQSGTSMKLHTDYPLQTRTYRHTQAPFVTLGVPVSRISHPDEFFVSVYLTWLHRMTNETEVHTIAHVSGGLKKVAIDFEAVSSFRELCDKVRTQLSAEVCATDAEMETVVCVNREIDSERPLMSWNLVQSDEAYVLRVSYDESLYKSSTMDDFIGYFIRILDEVSENPTVAPDDFDIVSETDKRLYLALNETDGPYPTDKTIHAMIEQAAKMYPTHVALEFNGVQLTYQSLDEQANQLANLLCAKGVQKGTFVAIVLGRSIEMIISLLAILKAGGVYVPIDPAHPEDRNVYILQDTAAPFVVTNEEFRPYVNRLRADLPTLQDVVMIRQDEVYFPTAKPEVSVSPSDLAYVIYTSGSTGRPKGALLKHAGAVNLGVAFQQLFSVTPSDVVTQFSTFSFDAAVWDTFGALFWGAKLYLLSFEERLSSEAFLQALSRTKTTIVPSIPTVFFNQLAQYDGLADCDLSKLRHLNVAGDAMYGENVRRFQKRFPKNVVVGNLYGPTEATVCTTAFKITDELPADLVHVPIGKPIMNYQVQIVNRKNRLCPPYVPGELLISTVGLSVGYLNQPEITQRSFIEHPFEAGKVAYRSGDIVRLLRNGNIEYVERKDSQVKIRGYRVEIGEIEDKLASLEDMQDIAVVARKDTTNEKILVAFYSTKSGHSISTQDMKEFLAARVPSYFIPTHFVHLQELPISPTGKIDRKSLAVVDYTPQSTVTGEVVLPATETEQLIASAWQATLGLHAIGVDENFFEIGGTSLKIIDVLVKLKPRFPGVRIVDFYECPTIRTLAERIEGLADEHVAPVRTIKEGTMKQGSTPIALEELPTAFGIDTETELPGLRDVFITGATGYLGAHLVHDLLSGSDATVHCLVRGTTNQTGLERLLETLALYFGEDFAKQQSDRLYVYEGNLQAPRLGLEENQWIFLTNTLDAIVHCAADVRHFGDRQHFEKTNVEGTKHVLELARSTPGVRFHHISTVGIPEELALSGQWASIASTGQFPSGLHVENVYTDSKLQAEMLVYDAAETGLQATIYRIGNLVCHSETGRFQRNIDSNAFYRMLKAMLLLERAPLVDWHVDITPVDYASGVILKLMQDSRTSGKVFHVCNPTPIHYTAMIDMIRACGYHIELMDNAAYVNWVLNQTDDRYQDAIQFAITQLEGDGAIDSPYIFDCKNVEGLVDKAQLNRTAVTQAFFEKLLGYAAEIGYFPTSQQTTSQTR
ncbi:non-ribosomal peptide synthetase [Alicyclobacillus acidoterrestris]|uniref:Amino acid adenylation domain-containing protein n=1 Tax=Alicyclobacillus acidoterrestris (strain ATCC 49025 / DSM 3922 / CIP 106132 / NCIMB 13137 / GD3B) TaxID=1356854 RepID=T0BZ88_ALIAG|nr:non-ribosomal peptide synthetase [Alicyclobacillus acidoterrestris]EPZ46064.1 hypothetical protein N007_01000 [Alicyclobacillus acidoterrestris ATCC 49025]UNO48758.1 amino acid adenylation domain-containing protein [Alicyclobacillus acidoterrestris]